MIYKVTAKGKLSDIHAALNDAFFGQWHIEEISRPDRKGITTLMVKSPVTITCVVEPITGIELKFNNLAA